MRSIWIYFLFLVLPLSAYGCFDSHKKGNGVDPGDSGSDVTIETGGAGGRDIPRAGSGGVNGGYVAVGNRDSIVRLIDAATIDVSPIQVGTGGVKGTVGISNTGEIDTDEDAIIDNAPCEPNCLDLHWVTIEGGTFQMGSAEKTKNGNERPQREVTVKSFKIMKTEVTVAQYGKCVEVGACSVPSVGLFPSLFNWGVSGRENHPLNGVNWNQAREFAQWIGGRLPSEAEWEYAACGGGQDIVYPWGNEEPSCERAVFRNINDDCGNPLTVEVCSKPLGNTAHGLCNMAGNVDEWVEDDWHKSYSGAPSDSQAWVDNPRRSYRVIRGGSWPSGPYKSRVAARYRDRPTAANPNHGFRLVLDIE